MLLSRASLLPAGAKGLLSHVISFLPPVHSASFTNTADAMMQVRCTCASLCQYDNGSNDPAAASAACRTLTFSNALRADARLSVMHAVSRTHRMNEALRASLARELCCQIVDEIGIDAFSNRRQKIRLLRLLGQGPWRPDTDEQCICVVMEKALLDNERLWAYLGWITGAYSTLGLDNAALGAHLPKTQAIVGSADESC